MRAPLFLFLALVVAALVPAVPAAAAPSADFDTVALDRFVTGYLDRHGLPGAAVAVVKDGEIVHQAGYGTDADGRRVTEHTKMRTASLSKSITAFAVLQLVDGGQVELDAPVARYLPEFTSSGAITVRQLLAHTSGLPNPAIVAPAASPRERVEALADLKPVSKPGVSPLYSNLNYWIAARLVEEVGGRPFGTYLADEIFTPAGMADTVGTTTTHDPVKGLAGGHVTAYGLAFPSPTPIEMNSGAGGVVSTAHDMGVWLATQQRGGTGPGGQRLLSAALVDESHTRQPNAPRHGLGWQFSSPEVEPARISHSGNTAGFNAQQDLIPESGYGVVTLLNGFSPSLEHAYEINSAVIGMTEGRTPEIGPAAATWTDLILGALTVTAPALGALGLRRAPRWAARRAAWPPWRFVARLLPQVIAPVTAVILFGVAPALQDNEFTAVDVFWLFPALAVLLVAAAVVGCLLTGMRVNARLRAIPETHGRAPGGLDR